MTSRRAWRRAPRRVQSRRRRLFRGVGLGVAVLWLLAPMVPLVLWAAADTWSYPDVLPSWGFGGWSTASGQGAGAAAGRSFLLGVVVAGLATPAGAAAGRALALHRFRLSRLASVCLLLPVAVPPFAVVMGLNIVALRLGVPGSVALVLVLVVAALPYTTYVMRAAYSTYDMGLEDEARSLGAAPKSVLWRVQLPLVAPALATAAFLAFLVAWSDYIVTLLLGGGRLVTLPILVGSLASGSGNDAAVAVASVAAIAPPLVLLAAAAMLARRGRWAR